MSDELKFKTLSDMGCVKIYSKDLSTFFKNGYGDGENTVYIKLSEYDINAYKGYDFVGSFTVLKNGSVYLSEYDCNLKPIYTFEIGRYFIYINEKQVVIQKIDEFLNC